MPFAIATVHDLVRGDDKGVVLKGMHEGGSTGLVAHDALIDESMVRMPDRSQVELDILTPWHVLGIPTNGTCDAAPDHARRIHQWRDAEQETCAHLGSRRDAAHPVGRRSEVLTFVLQYDFVAAYWMDDSHRDAAVGGHRERRCQAAERVLFELVVVVEEVHERPPGERQPAIPDPGRHPPAGDDTALIAHPRVPYCIDMRLGRILGTVVEDDHFEVHVLLSKRRGRGPHHVLLTPIGGDHDRYQGSAHFRGRTTRFHTMRVGPVIPFRNLASGSAGTSAAGTVMRRGKK